MIISIYFENVQPNLQFLKNPCRDLFQSSLTCVLVHSFVLVVLLKCSFTVLGGYFHISLDLGAIFVCLNLVKIRDTAP